MRLAAKAIELQSLDPKDVAHPIPLSQNGAEGVGEAGKDRFDQVTR